MKKTVFQKREISVFRTWVGESLPRLKKMKKEEDRKAFDAIMEKVMPEVKLYMKRQIAISLFNKALPEGKYKIDDFIDEIYLAAYDHIQEVTDAGHLHHWLFEKADEILEDIIIEEDFDNMFFENIENYTDGEWDAMEERFTRDADGDLIMLEELDDPSYTKQKYPLADIFINSSEEEILEKLEISLNNEKSQNTIQKLIESILFIMPYKFRAVFELYIIQRFNVNEIANIRRITPAEVSEILVRAREFIKKAIAMRDLTDKLSR